MLGFFFLFFSSFPPGYTADAGTDMKVGEADALARWHHGQKSRRQEMAVRSVRFDQRSKRARTKNVKVWCKANGSRVVGSEVGTKIPVAPAFTGQRKFARGEKVTLREEK
jgi:hypothetical protein